MYNAETKKLETCLPDHGWESRIHRNGQCPSLSSFVLKFLLDAK
uniref:Photosynthetic NDH subunit of subcomplex B 3ic n=1 Tax=Rhizophora mucronata TaxID=61149 RepID=A0A2P2LJF4_RHIMU